MAEKSSPPLVLVADDEPSMLELVARHLRTMSDPKLEVIQASDGEEAWRLAREHLPDLVVLDVMMPGMSGWEVCRKIREDVALAHTGVVMLTGIGENLNQMTSRAPSPCCRAICAPADIRCSRLPMGTKLGSSRTSTCHTW